MKIIMKIIKYIVLVIIIILILLGYLFYRISIAMNTFVKVHSISFDLAEKNVGPNFDKTNVIEMFSEISDQKKIDSWGNTILIEITENDNKKIFKVYSRGSDGIKNTKDDIFDVWEYWKKEDVWYNDYKQSIYENVF